MWCIMAGNTDQNTTICWWLGLSFVFEILFYEIAIYVRLLTISQSSWSYNMFFLFFFHLSARRACVAAALFPDAATSSEEAAAAHSSSSGSNCSPESRAATARTGHCTAEGEHHTSRQRVFTLIICWESVPSLCPQLRPQIQQMQIFLYMRVQYCCLVGYVYQYGMVILEPKVY